MREHQIVITLKPEQFLQVQRLARTSGAKSMGMFVRQKLLTALGIEGSVDSNPDKMDIAQMQTVADELKRLHSELKDFANESFSVHGLDAAVELDKVPMPTISGQKSILEAESDAQPLHELEKLADHTFAISPRLGAFEPAANSLSSELRDPLSELLGQDELYEEFMEPLEPDFLYQDQEAPATMPPSPAPSAISGATSAVNQAASTKASATAPAGTSPAATKPSVTAPVEVSKSEPIEEDDFVPPALQERRRQLALAKENEEAEKGQEDKSGSSSASTEENQNTRPLDSVPEEIPFSGGPPPKRPRE